MLIAGVRVARGSGVVARARRARRRPGPVLRRPARAGDRRCTRRRRRAHVGVVHRGRPGGGPARLVRPIAVLRAGRDRTAWTRPRAREKSRSWKRRSDRHAGGRSGGGGRRGGRHPVDAGPPALPEDSPDVTMPRGAGCRHRQHLPRRRRLRSRGGRGALRGRALPARVRVVDYGIRGMHLAYDLLDRWDALVLVDALPYRGAPGRVAVLEADPTTWCPAQSRRARHGSRRRSSRASRARRSRRRGPWWSAARSGHR